MVPHHLLSQFLQSCQTIRRGVYACRAGLLASEVKHAASQQAVKSTEVRKLWEGVEMAAYLVKVRLGLSVKETNMLYADLTWSQNRVVSSPHLLYTDPLWQKDIQQSRADA